MHQVAIQACSLNTSFCAPRPSPPPLSCTPRHGALKLESRCWTAASSSLLLPLPLMHPKAWRPEARVSVLDSGFILGDGVWEGLRLHRGVLMFAEAHLERL